MLPTKLYRAGTCSGALNFPQNDGYIVCRQCLRLIRTISKLVVIGHSPSVNFVATSSAFFHGTRNLTQKRFSRWKCKRRCRRQQTTTKEEVQFDFRMPIAGASKKIPVWRAPTNWFRNVILQEHELMANKVKHDCKFLSFRYLKTKEKNLKWIPAREKETRKFIFDKLYYNLSERADLQKLVVEATWKSYR